MRVPPPVPELIILFSANSQVERISVCFWERQRPDAYGSLDAGHPVFIKYDYPQHVYGLPALEYPNHIKVCLQCFDAVGWAAGRASGL